MTICALFFAAGMQAALAQTKPPNSLSSGDSRQAVAASHAAATHTVHWEQMPLADAVERLERMSNVAVYVDRRIDPTQRVDLSSEDATPDEIAARLASVSVAGACKLGDLNYIGPKNVAKRLPTLAAQRRKEIQALSGDAKGSLLERKRVGWARLSVPRELITKLLEEHGWRVANSEAIPYDLWAEGQLPLLPLADQLTVLLAGFDLTYRVRPGERVLEIVPVDWDTIEPAERAATPTVRPKQLAANAKQVYSLRVENQPVGRILDQLGERFHWKLDIDEAAIRRGGRSLDTLVSFKVENVDADALLRAILEPAGMTFERDGERVRIDVK